MINPSFRSGFHETHGVRVDRVLVASTCHMKGLEEDLTPWDWGRLDQFGVQWFYAYEEDPGMETPIPSWLLDLCKIARNTYGCNWVLLDPDGDIIDGLPVFDH